MTLKRLGKPPFLNADEVEDGEVVTIIEEPYVVPAERTKYGRDRGRMVVKVGKEIRTWSPNNTTWDTLLENYGPDEKQWVKKKVKINKEIRNINGVDRPVLFGSPFHEPQQELAAPEKENAEAILATLDERTKKALAEKLKES